MADMKASLSYVSHSHANYPMGALEVAAHASGMSFISD